MEAQSSALFPPIEVAANEPQLIRARVIKLRWIGLDEEAEQLAAELARVEPETILAETVATD